VMLVLPAPDGAVSIMIFPPFPKLIKLGLREDRDVCLSIVPALQAASY
jgi:hypothetical protein